MKKAIVCLAAVTAMAGAAFGPAALADTGRFYVGSEVQTSWDEGRSSQPVRQSYLRSYVGYETTAFDQTLGFSAESGYNTDLSDDEAYESSVCSDNSRTCNFYDITLNADYFLNQSTSLNGEVVMEFEPDEPVRKTVKLGFKTLL